MRTPWKTLSIAAVACVVGTTMTSPVSAATAAERAPTTVVANYQMQNDTGTTMTDSTGSHDGVIAADAAGAGLDTHVASDDGFGYQWAMPTVVSDSRVVTVADAAELDPGAREFAVEAKVKTGATDGVIVQKGLSTSPGGQWRMQLIDGQVS